ALTELRRAATAGHPFPLVLLDAWMPELDGFELAEQIGRLPELAGSRMIILASADQRADISRCRELGVAAFLTKPVKQSELLDAILTVFDPTRADVKGASRRIRVHRSPTPRPQPARRLRILLAEDNPVNQRLAVVMLERLGHEVEVAGTGTEAVAAVKKR